MPFTPDSLPDLTGRVYLVTGGNAGIGLETIKVLAKLNARIYLGARSTTKAEEAIAKIKEGAPNASVTFLKLDHMDLQSIVDGARSFLSKESQLHGLMLNAGIMCTPYEVSKDGYEAHFQTNYLSHFLLAALLLPVLKSTAENSEPGAVRIVVMTSVAYTNVSGIAFNNLTLKDDTPFKRYCQSKLANILHMRGLQSRVGPTSGEPKKGEIWVTTVHPGLVDTGLAASSAKTMWITRFMLKIGAGATPEAAAYTPLFALASDDFDRSWSGSYIAPVAKKSRMWRSANDEALAETLWTWTESELKTKGFLL